MLILAGCATLFFLLNAIFTKEAVLISLIPAVICLVVFFFNLKLFFLNRRTAAVEEIIDISDDAVLEEALQAKITVLFKHSTQCGISSVVYGYVRQFMAQKPEIPVYVIRVIENRALSNKIQDRLGITPQSPQAIVLKNGKAVWHGSHYQIDVETLKEQVIADPSMSR
jgi:bacillithiol system protein YtxJ